MPFLEEEQFSPEEELGPGEPTSSEFEDEDESSDSDTDLRQRRRMSQLEALLLSSTEPLTETSFTNAVGKRAGSKIAELVAALNLEYEAQQRSFEILPVAGGYMLFTRPEHGDMIRRFLAEKARTRLSRAALESLAVIAFRGPVTRVEIDEIRGVDSGGVLRNLLDRHLIRVKGRAELVGRPLLYEITDEFLKYFGITSVADLPRHAELTRELGELHHALPDQESLVLGEPLESVEQAETDVRVDKPKTGNGHHKLTAQELTNGDEPSDDEHTKQ